VSIRSSRHIESAAVVSRARNLRRETLNTPWEIQSRAGERLTPLSKSILMYGDSGWLSDCLRIRAGLSASSPVLAAHTHTHTHTHTYYIYTHRHDHRRSV
jgi:hypothetical protein